MTDWQPEPTGVHAPSCPLCLQPYNLEDAALVPRLLHCFHTFCHGCLLDISDHKGGDEHSTIECPTCSHHNPVGETGISSFRTNFLVSHELALAEFNHDLKHIECDDCDNDDRSAATTRCLDCNEFYCDIHGCAHIKSKITKSHRVIPMAEFKQTRPKMLRKPDLCFEHTGERLSLFCLQCQETICRDCLIHSHRNHNFGMLEDEAKVMRKDLVELMSNSRQLLPTLRARIAETEAVENTLADRLTTVQNQIKEQFRYYRAALDVREDQLLTHAAELAGVRTGQIEPRKARLQNKLSKVEGSCDFADSLLKDGSDAQLMAMKIHLEEHLGVFVRGPQATNNQAGETNQLNPPDWVENEELEPEADLVFTPDPDIIAFLIASGNVEDKAPLTHDEAKLGAANFEDTDYEQKHGGHDAELDVMEVYCNGESFISFPAADWGFTADSESTITISCDRDIVLLGVALYGAKEGTLEGVLSIRQGNTNADPIIAEQNLVIPARDQTAEVFYFDSPPTLYAGLSYTISEYVHSDNGTGYYNDYFSPEFNVGGAHFQLFPTEQGSQGHQIVQPPGARISGFRFMFAEPSAEFHDDNNHHNNNNNHANNNSHDYVDTNPQTPQPNAEG